MARRRRRNPKKSTGQPGLVMIGVSVIALGGLAYILFGTKKAHAAGADSYMAEELGGGGTPQIPEAGWDPGAYAEGALFTDTVPSGADATDSGSGATVYTTPPVVSPSASVPGGGGYGPVPHYEVKGVSPQQSTVAEKITAIVKAQASGTAALKDGAGRKAASGGGRDTGRGGLFSGVGRRFSTFGGRA